MRWIVHCSGGWDSTAVLLWCREKGILFDPVFYDYGQPYIRQEWARAENICMQLRQKLLVCQVPLVPGRMEGSVAAYVPLRNLVLMAHSCHLALLHKACAVAVGFKSEVAALGDPYAFRDSGRWFIERFNSAVAVGCELNQLPPKVVMPLTGWSKQRIVEYVLASGLFSPKDLWNCYEDGSEPCGECFHCREMLPILEKVQKGNRK